MVKEVTPCLHIYLSPLSAIGSQIAESRNLAAAFYTILVHAKIHFTFSRFKE